jgi:hypothetical protein
LYLQGIHVEADVGERVAPYWLWEVVNEPEEAGNQHEDALLIMGYTIQRRMIMRSERIVSRGVGRHGDRKVGSYAPEFLPR